MQYQVSALSGEPQNLIKSLSISAANYLITYQLLRDSYHNSRRLSTLYLIAVLGLPTVTLGKTHALRQLFFNSKGPTLIVPMYQVWYRSI